MTNLRTQILGDRGTYRGVTISGIDVYPINDTVLTLVRTMRPANTTALTVRFWLDEKMYDHDLPMRDDLYLWRP